MSAAPTITAIAPWFGGKRTLAPRIVAELGRHSFYVEPFCGSMAVLLAKPPASMELVNDLHSDLINLARVLASVHAEELYARASRVLMHDGIHSEAREAIFGVECEPAPSIDEVKLIHVERAMRYLIMSWQGRNGSGGTRKGNVATARRFTSNGGSGGLRWRQAVESIPAWHERLRTVSMSSMDAFELLDRLGDQDGTAIYCDPPYIAKSDKYVHDLIPEDHPRLATALRRFKNARIVLSYYEEPALRDLYRGWTFVPCPIAKSLANQARRDEEGVVMAPEVLIINGPSLTAGGLFGGAH